MAIGMTYEQYWYGDPLMVRAFYQAEKIRRKRVDEEAWLYGLYFLRALDAIVGNAFRKSGTPLAEYPKEPLHVTSDKDAALSEEQREENEATFALAYMTSMVEVGKNWGKHQ